MKTVSATLLIQICFTIPTFQSSQTKPSLILSETLAMQNTPASWNVALSPPEVPAGQILGWSKSE